MKQKLINLIRYLWSLLGAEKTGPTPEEDRAMYLEDVEKAHREWQLALHNFNFYVAQDLVDYGVRQISAAEKKYMYLMKEARAQNITTDQLRVVS